MARSVQDPEHKALPSLLPSLLGLLFERSFAATAARPAYVEAAANCSTTGGRRIVRGTVLYGTRDVRFEERPDPMIVEPTDAIIRISAACVCGSDLLAGGFEAVPSG
jgi:hypothetical protein